MSGAGVLDISVSDQVQNSSGVVSNANPDSDNFVDVGFRTRSVSPLPESISLAAVRSPSKMQANDSIMGSGDHPAETIDNRQLPIVQIDPHRIPDLQLSQKHPPDGESSNDNIDRILSLERKKTSKPSIFVPKLEPDEDPADGTIVDQLATVETIDSAKIELLQSPSNIRVLRSASKPKKAPAKSPYFTPSVSPVKRSRANSVKKEDKSVQENDPSPSKLSPSKRSPGGMVSCIPFPPLSAPYFGLIQEKLASDPFRLLVAVTFLIRTHGKHAIPVFYELMEKYPTPESLVDANKEDIVPIIRHLGLQNQRASTYQTYAQIWLTKKPTHGVRYPVRDYPEKGDGRDVLKDEILDDLDERQAWEIGHMTQGPYAIDSWRIFCRDVCRGIAKGWNGEGSEEGFQPEWMRVLPKDKELRAYLRWMWLKEGFEWDPFTGDKEVASQKLMRAAIEGRIAWDDQGGMRIIDENEITFDQDIKKLDLKIKE